MEERGWDAAIFHAVGVGATMEDLIRSGLITALLDITPGELTNTLFKSVYGISESWGGERLTAASDTGIPQVIVPGGLDQCAYGALETMPKNYLDDFRTGRRRSYHGTGLPYQHNDAVTIMVPTLDEIESVSRYIADKVNSTRGSTCLVIPMRGWSAYDQSEALATRDRGWAEGNGDGPVWDPDPEHPSWSRRATRMLSVLKDSLNIANSNLDLIAIDHHILDPELADLVNRCMGDMLDGKWRRGLYRDVPKVLD